MDSSMFDDEVTTILLSKRLFLIKCDTVPLNAFVVKYGISYTIFNYDDVFTKKKKKKKKLKKKKKKKKNKK